MHSTSSKQMMFSFWSLYNPCAVHSKRTLCVRREDILRGKKVSTEDKSCGYAAVTISRLTFYWLSHRHDVLSLHFYFSCPSKDFPWTTKGHALSMLQLRKQCALGREIRGDSAALWGWMMTTVIEQRSKSQRQRWKARQEGSGRSKRRGPLNKLGLAMIFGSIS